MSVKRAAAARAQQGVDAFEKAVRALGRKDYARARDLLDALIAGAEVDRDPETREALASLLDRARAYRLVCERGMDKRPSFRPKGFEDLLNYGVFLHNRGDFEEALRHLLQAADIHPKNEHVLYCIAVASARAGDATGAIKALRSAIGANPANRTQARSDPDFDSLREDEEFAALLEPPGA
jgi:tetratricopeptide (TPR) repeat protein